MRKQQNKTTNKTTTIWMFYNRILRGKGKKCKKMAKFILILFSLTLKVSSILHPTVFIPISFKERKTEKKKHQKFRKSGWRKRNREGGGKWKRREKSKKKVQFAIEECEKKGKRERKKNNSKCKQILSPKRTKRRRRRNRKREIIPSLYGANEASSLAQCALFFLSLSPSPCTSPSFLPHSISLFLLQSLPPINNVCFLGLFFYYELVAETFFLYYQKQKKI